MKKTFVFKGLLLGIVFFLAMLFQKPVGVSTQFSVASGIIENFAEGDKDTFTSSSQYYNEGKGAIAKEIANPFSYEMIFILGIFLGALVGSRIFPKERLKMEKDFRDEPLSGKIILKLFSAGFLLLFGARMAGGCTSGHMMSGISQMSLSSFIFTAVLFPMAILAAKKWGD